MSKADTSRKGSGSLRDACEEFRGGLYSFTLNGRSVTYYVGQIIAFLDSGGTEAQIYAGALEKDADAALKQYAAEQRARFLGHR